MQKSLNLLFQRILSFMFLLFKNISTPRVRKQCCLPLFFFKISLRDTSFYISLNSLGFYLSPKSLLNFRWLIHSTMCGELFSIYGVHIPRKFIVSMHFYLCPSQSSTQNSRQKRLKLCFPQDDRRGRNYGLLYQNYFIYNLNSIDF